MSVEAGAPKLGALLGNASVRRARSWGIAIGAAILFLGAVVSRARELIDGIELLVRVVDVYRAVVYPLKDAFLSIWPQWMPRPSNQQFDYFMIAVVMVARVYDWPSAWAAISSRIKRRIWPPYPRSLMRRPEVRKGSVLLDVVAVALVVFPLGWALYIAFLLDFWRSPLWQVGGVLALAAMGWWISRSEPEESRKVSRRKEAAFAFVGVFLIGLHALNAHADTALPFVERLWDAGQRTFDDLAGAGRELRPKTE